MSAALVWTPDRIAAVCVGAALLFALFVFFFGRRTIAFAAAGTIDAPEVTVVVEGGYSPDLILARRGVPLRLVFDRRDEGPCTDEVVFPDFGVRRSLAPHEKTVVELFPERSGEFSFSCGMNMLHGKIRVSP